MLGSKLSEVELSEHEITLPDGYFAVWGEDWEGNRTIRPLRPGYETVLRGKTGQQFDVRGPVVSMCRDCEEILLSAVSAEHTSTIQHHYSEAHDYVPGMLTCNT